MLSTSYQGQLFAKTKSADTVFSLRVAGRLEMRETADRASMKAAARRIVHYPCRSRYTLVTTTTETLLMRALSAVQARLPAVVTVVVTVLAASAWLLWRSRSRRH
jgi:hypothetical protein